jgi:hypothetical protein
MDDKRSPRNVQKEEGVSDGSATSSAPIRVLALGRGNRDLGMFQSPNDPADHGPAQFPQSNWELFDMNRRLLRSTPDGGVEPVPNKPPHPPEAMMGRIRGAIESARSEVVKSYHPDRKRELEDLRTLDLAALLNALWQLIIKDYPCQIPDCWQDNPEILKEKILTTGSYWHYMFSPHHLEDAAKE